MDECDLEDVKCRVANNHLSFLLREHKGTITISALSRLSRNEKVEKVLIETPAIEICENCSHGAKVERMIMNPFRRFYLFLKGYVRKEISFRETVCGTVLIITMTVFETRKSF